VFPLRDNVPTRSFPVVTVALIVANVLVWLLELGGTPAQEDIYRYGYYPCTVDGPCLSPPIPAGIEPLRAWVAAFTSMFIHADWLHLIGNMVFLWIFGNNVEDAMGHGRFLAWYIAAGLAATAAQSTITLWLGTPVDASIPNVGASGAIAGVLGAYLLLYPSARVLTLLGWIPIELPALFFLGFWFLFQLWLGSFQLLEPESGGGVAFFAHIGGFIFGMLTILLVAKRRKDRYRSWR
jgi:membrane associated rhomboid family serine protease